MQYLNDDNMDELFRRAADDYPLNTNSQNWEKVATALQTANAGAASDANAAKKNSYRKYLWLLLLLPVIWICNGRMFSNDAAPNGDNLAVRKSEQPKKVSSTGIKEAEHKNAKIGSGNDQTGGIAKKLPDTNAMRVKADPGLQTNPLNEPAEAISADRSSINNIDQTVLQNRKLNAPGLRSNKQTNSSRESLGQRQTGYNRIDPGKELTNSKSARLEEPIRPGADGKNNTVSDLDKTNDPVTGITSDHTAQVISARDSSGTSAGLYPERTNSAEKTQSPEAAKKSLAANHKVHFLYAGLTGGFDVSTVAFQSVKSTGYTAGILLGYQLNKKLSIESGFLYDKKYYYTEGKYFNTSKIPLYPNTSILNATGDCYMFEIPVNIKYNWTSTSKSNWFSTLGMSSYFMKKETYSYTYEVYGWPVPGKPISYDESSANWFGVINLSGGYIHTLGKAGSLRVEPYLKIPVQKLGIGNLSIWSTGIYVSFIKKIF